MRSKSEIFEANAQRCLQQAERSPDRANKLLFRQLAADWLDLARMLEMLRVDRECMKTLRARIQ